MRYGIISDIHGNLEALHAVLEACRRQNIEKSLCVGDIVGYGANPRECLAALMEIQAVCVAGNHDWAVVGKLDASYFLEDGKEAIHWTRNALSMEMIALMASLNLECHNEDLIMVHSSPFQPEAFTYLRDVETAGQAFQVMKQPICFIGHTHVPKVFAKRNDRIIQTNMLEFEIAPDCQYIVNVGSVGQPRDGNPMAAYCIYDTDMQMIEIKRTKYNIKLAQRKIIEAGLPEFLAQRLTHGR